MGFSRHFHEQKTVGAIQNSLSISAVEEAIWPHAGFGHFPQTRALLGRRFAFSLGYARPFARACPSIDERKCPVTIDGE